MVPISPNGGITVTRKGRWTSKEGDGSTSVDADVPLGGCLQLLGGYSTGSALANSAGTVTADDGYAFGRPGVENLNHAFAIVDENMLPHERAFINTETTSGIRDGGHFQGVVGGVCRALIKASAVLTANVTLLEAVDDQFYLQPCSRSGLLYAAVADSAAVTSTNTETAFDKTYTIPANTLNVGDLLEIEFSALVSAAANTDTLVLKLYIGSQEVIATGTPDTVTNDVIVGRAIVQIRTIGTSGTYVANAITGIATPSAAAGAADIVSVDTLGSTAINTTTTNVVSVKATWSVADAGDSVVLKTLSIRKVAASSLGGGPIAVAMETATVGSSAELKKVRLLQPLF